VKSFHHWMKNEENLQCKGPHLKKREKKWHYYTQTMKVGSLSKKNDYHTFVRILHMT